ncbi:MAG: TIGR04086 family membrane protein [Oscillospiraceae bacterium]|jgi:putative membrane protein (TIGR04086 family)|nr:TIGR04086 family membrane protein [Oscillospiraceae bacterium]
MERKTSRKVSRKAIFEHPAVSSVIGAGLAIVISVVFLMIASALTLSGTIAEEQMRVTAAVCGTAATFIGAKAAAVRVSDKKLLTAVGSAMIMFIIVFAIGRFVSDRAIGGGFAILSGAASIGAGALAGVKRVKARRRSEKR